MTWSRPSSGRSPTRATMTCGPVPVTFSSCNIPLCSPAPRTGPALTVQRTIAVARIEIVGAWVRIRVAAAITTDIGSARCGLHRYA